MIWQPEGVGADVRLGYGLSALLALAWIRVAWLTCCVLDGGHDCKL